MHYRVNAVQRTITMGGSLQTVLAAATTLPTLDPTKFGLADYDFYGGAVNFLKAKQNGVKRAIIRVGQGFYGLDPQFKASQSNAKIAGMPRDFYWFLDIRQSANGQARDCVNAIGSGYDEDSILFADFESTYSTGSGKTYEHLDAAFLWGFLTTVHLLNPKIKLGIYTGYSFWKTYGSIDPKYGFQNYPLWISWPVSPYQAPLPLAPWGNNWLYHQWTFNGNGSLYGYASGGIDLNYMNPVYVPANLPPIPEPAPAPIPEPVPTPTPVPAPVPVNTDTIYEVIGDPAANIRSDPSFPVANDNLVGYALKGSQIYGSPTADGKFLRLSGYVAMSVLKEHNIPTPAPSPVASNLYRILTDGELPASYGFGGKSRTAQDWWAGGAITPATVKLHGDDPVRHLDAAAVALVEKLDIPHGTFGYITRTAAGWSNRGEVWPETVEPVVFEGNVVEVLSVDEVHNRAYLKMWNGETDPILNPAVIHRWTTIDKKNNLQGCQNPGGDGTGYIVLAYPGVYWIELDRLAKVE